MIRSVGILLVCGAQVAACAPYEIEDSRRVLLESWAQGVLFPRYDATLESIGDLDIALAGLCETPDEASLEAAQLAWWQARGPWKQTEVFAFGPFKEEPLRLGPKIDGWPLRPDTVQAVLDADSPIDDAAVEALGIYAKGFPALEYLLFHPVADLSLAFAEDGRRCLYLHALVDDLDSKVAALDSAWQPAGGAFLLELTRAGSESRRYDSLEEALSEVVNRMGFAVENIQVDKLATPLGDVSGNDPRPELAESFLSGRSVEDIRDNLRGINALFVGEPTSSGLDAYLTDQGYYFADRMQERMEAAHLALAAIDLPLTVALVEERELVADAQAELFKLQTLIQIDLLEALTLELEFNDADGD